MDKENQSTKDTAEVKIQRYRHALEVIAEDLKEYYPKTVLLFGSLARWLAGEIADRPPNDMDLLIVGNSRPFKVEKKDYGVSVQLNRLMVDQMVGIAKSLRYDTKVAALSKLYSKNVVKQHSIDVIAASLLLGPGYNDFGIESKGLSTNGTIPSIRLFLGKPGGIVCVITPLIDEAHGNVSPTA